MFFPVRLASVQSHAAPACGMCDESQKVFLLKPNLLDEAYEGGRGRQLTDASLSLAAGAEES